MPGTNRRTTPITFINPFCQLDNQGRPTTSIEICKDNVHFCTSSSGGPAILWNLRDCFHGGRPVAVSEFNFQGEGSFIHASLDEKSGTIILSDGFEDAIACVQSSKSAKWSLHDQKNSRIYRAYYFSAEEVIAGISPQRILLWDAESVKQNLIRQVFGFNWKRRLPSPRLAFEFECQDIIEFDSKVLTTHDLRVFAIPDGIGKSVTLLKRIGRLKISKHLNIDIQGLVNGYVEPWLAVAINFYGHSLLVIMMNQPPLVLSVDNGKVISRLEGMGFYVYRCGALDSKGGLAFLGRNDGNVDVQLVSDGMILSALRGANASVEEIKISRDDRLAAVRFGDGRVLFYDISILKY